MHAPLSLDDSRAAVGLWLLHASSLGDCTSTCTCFECTLYLYLAFAARRSGHSLHHHPQPARQAAAAADARQRRRRHQPHHLRQSTPEFMLSPHNLSLTIAFGTVLEVLLNNFSHHGIEFRTCEILHLTEIISCVNFALRDGCRVVITLYVIYSTRHNCTSNIH